ncbi:hypothetical protein AVEN_2181-1 [Araneus ventricosus]|uniref:Uncharacterized protein n=1 Tax=Araneus ventricosus TaxID=182803 RepID=A0A4Y2WJ89_ARAVE|nr:hypothetical protein AVEN_2181-1 [Araneus ventricosus]
MTTCRMLCSLCHFNSLNPKRPFSFRSFKTRTFLGGSDMNWTVPTLWSFTPPHHPLTFPSPSIKTQGKGLRFARLIGPLPRLSPKPSQNLTSTQKKPAASDRPSSLLTEIFKPPGTVSVGLIRLIL